MNNYQTPKVAGYKYIYFDKGEYAFLNIDTGLIEFFKKSRNISGWALNYKNTQLEFCHSYNDGQMLQFINGLKKIQNFGEQHPSFNFACRALKNLC